MNALQYAYDSTKLAKIRSGIRKKREVVSKLIETASLSTRESVLSVRFIHNQNCTFFFGEGQA